MTVNKTVHCHAYKFQTQIFSVIFQVDCGVFFFYLINITVFWTLSSVSGYKAHKLSNTGSVSIFR